MRPPSSCCASGGDWEGGQAGGGLIRYLYATGPAQQEGRGRRNRHVDPHLVAGFDDPDQLEPAVNGRGRREFRRLISLLEVPLAAAGVGPDKKPVYHLVIAARKDPQSGELVDRWLADEAWADIAATYLDRLGLAPRGDELGCRWVAVRHADDHVHVVATLARQDGRRVFPRNDYWRAGEASRAVEAKYGLTVTAAADHTAAKRASYAETAKAARAGRAEPARDTLRRSVRSAAAGAADVNEFFARLAGDGLAVRPRYSERTPGEVTGYAVALPGSVDPARPPIWFGGRKLAADLTLLQLRRRWEVGVPPGSAATAGGSDPTPGRGAGPAAETTKAGPAAGREAGRPEQDRDWRAGPERAWRWAQAIAAAAAAADHISTAAAGGGGDLEEAADAAWAAADMLAAAARMVEGRAGGPLTGAADGYTRAARERWSHTPPRSAAGVGLRTAGRLLSATRFAGGSDIAPLLALLTALAALTDAVHRLRDVQHRAAQAAAARTAAEQVSLAGARWLADQVRTLTAQAAAARTSRPPPAHRRPHQQQARPHPPPPDHGRHR